MIAHTLIAYAFVLLMLLVALAAASLICRVGKTDGQATKSSGEWARKLVHMSMGLVCMSFPWLFRDNISVVILAALALISLVLVRFTPLAGALFSVGRKSTGDLLFPVAVAMTFALSQNAMQYFLALSLLTFADSTAAVIGKKYGQHFFAQGRKSLEGSLAFLACAIVVTLSINLGTGNTVASSLANTLALALASTLAEALSNNGFDNLSIPMCALMVMKCCA